MTVFIFKIRILALAQYDIVLLVDVFVLVVIDETDFWLEVIWKEC